MRGDGSMRHSFGVQDDVEQGFMNVLPRESSRANYGEPESDYGVSGPCGRPICQKWAEKGGFSRFGAKNGLLEPKNAKKSPKMAQNCRF